MGSSVAASSASLSEHEPATSVVAQIAEAVSRVAPKPTCPGWFAVWMAIPASKLL
jgi:hypothetical protein